jgi:Amt family ammonium transporter
MDTGDTAWILASAALVLLMTPGLAFFYGGMTRAKSVLNMMMMSFAALAVVPVLWVLYGYSLAFSPGGNGWLGGFDRLGFANIGVDTAYGTIPEFVFAGFQLMFAIITVALISGAIADRAKFSGWLVFVVVWVTVVYFPVAHWVFDFGGSDGEGGGWIATQLEAVDFAGGTAVHINAGAAGLALALVLGKRTGWKRDPMRPHNLPFVLLGAGLLWFGWFGFNAGSAVGANGLAGLAFVNTAVATAGAIVGWLAYEFVKEKKGTSLGAASGAVAGLVAVTPAAGALSPFGSIVLGLVAGVVCAAAVSLKWKLGFDDSLDVVGVHLVGGLIGTVLIGFLATTSTGGGAPVDGLFYGGDAALLGKQVLAAVVVMVFSFVLTWIIGKLIDVTIGFRLDPEDEVTGIDQVEHLESAYDYTGGSGGSPFKTGV